MRVLVRDLHEQPVDLEVDCSPAHLDLTDPEFRFPQKVVGTVHFRMLGDKVMAEGELSTQVEADCVRCLKKVLVPVSAPVCIVYEHNPELLKPEIEFLGSEEESLAYFDGEVIHPEPQFREAIMLELPQLPVCDETCKGLCPACGADRNLHPCSCKIVDLPQPPSSNSSSWKASIQNLKLNSEEEKS